MERSEVRCEDQKYGVASVLELRLLILEERYLTEDTIEIYKIMNDAKEVNGEFYSLYHNRRISCLVHIL